MTLICFAVKEEAQFFSRHTKERPNTEILLTGMGCRNAEKALRSALALRRFGIVISSGFAGGLDPGLKRGAVVIDADEGFPLTPNLLGAGARSVRFYCSDHVVVTSQEKAQLWRSTGAHAVEMESRVIRTICLANATPSATVRVISDAADENLQLDFNQFLTAGFKMNFTKLFRALVRKPSRIGALLRFQKQVRAASRQLADTLIQSLDGSG